MSDDHAYQAISSYEKVLSHHREELAHFYKFYDEIKNIIGNEFNVPSQLESVLKKEKNSWTNKRNIL